MSGFGKFLGTLVILFFVVGGVIFFYAVAMSLEDSEVRGGALAILFLLGVLFSYYVIGPLAYKISERF